MIKRWSLCVLAALGIACSGGSDGGVAPENQPPTITFTFTKIGVVKNTPTILSVSVKDPDGDPTTVSWSITRGTLTPQNASHTQMSWAVPATTGEDTVVVTASDGNFTRKITEPILVGSSAQTYRAVYFKSQSPYIVSVADPNNPVFPVDENTTSTIEAGVELLLEDPGTLIDVGGNLVSQGTSAEPVVIRPNVRGLQCGDERGWWDGIRVTRSSGAAVAGSVTLAHTEIWYGKDGVLLAADGSASLNGCAIKCSSEAGVRHDGAGKLRLVATEISNGALDGIVIGRQVSTALPDSVLIDHCEIRFNEKDGIVVNIDDQANAVPITVTFNRIENNLQRGITLARAAFPAVHFNNFSGNGVLSGVSNIYLEDGYPNGAGVTALSATCNYFGVTSQSSIDATIRDSLDAPVLVGTRVDTDPWLTSNPLITPPNCTP